MSIPKILYIAPLKDFSGYATAARDYVRALDSVGCNLVTRCLRYDGGDFKFSKRESELNNRNTQDVKIIIQHTTPNETFKKDGIFNVNYFAWETDRVPDEWVNQLNVMDLVLVPCEENIIAARRSGVQTPIAKVPHTFRKEPYENNIAPLVISGSEDYFKILSICQISRKKGLDVLLQSYLSEFSPEDKTILIIKVYFSSQDNEEHKKIMVEHIKSVKDSLRLKQYPKIFLIHGVVDDSMIERLYKTSDCYCLPSRGEGWGIPYFDALGYGVPPIAVNWGGPTEFISKDCGWLVDYNMSPCFDMAHPHDYMYTARDNWAEPHVNSVRSAMREAFHEWKVHNAEPDGSVWSKRIKLCKESINKFSYDIVGNHMNSVIMKYYEEWNEQRY